MPTLPKGHFQRDIGKFKGCSLERRDYNFPVMKFKDAPKTCRLKRCPFLIDDGGLFKCGRENELQLYTAAFHKTNWDNPKPMSIILLAKRFAHLGGPMARVANTPAKDRKRAALQWIEEVRAEKKNDVQGFF